MFPKRLQMLFRNNSRSTHDCVNSCRLWQQPLHVISIMFCQRHSPLQNTELISPEESNLNVCRGSDIKILDIIWYTNDTFSLHYYAMFLHQVKQNTLLEMVNSVQNVAFKRPQQCRCINTPTDCIPQVMGNVSRDMKFTVFWHVTARSLVDTCKVSEEYASSISTA